MRGVNAGDQGALVIDRGLGCGVSDAEYALRSARLVAQIAGYEMSLDVQLKCN